jgi:hypothetical protein
MRPGDKVRFLHSKGEGIIRKIIDQKTFEVEIEEGFLIPVLKSEIVIVHSEESTESSSRQDAVSSSIESANEGFYFAFIPFNDKLSSIHLINESSSEVLYTLGEESRGSYKAISSGILKQRGTLKITDVSLADFDKWPDYIVQALYFKPGISKLREPLLKRLNFKANTFFKSKQTAPLLNKDGYVFRIDAELENIVADPKKIMEEMFNKNPEPLNVKTLTKPAKEVDLHIENLVTDFSKMTNAEMMELQLKTFERTLDNAIAMGMEEIIFIHGVGNGVLRQSIHKALSQNKNIQFYQDAQKGKFGYGATMVKIK